MHVGKPKLIILLVLSITPSRISQKFYQLFLIYSHAFTYDSYVIPYFLFCQW